MLPLYDETPHRRTPVVVVTFIAACVVIMGYEFYLWKVISEARLTGFVDAWGLVPVRMRPGAQPETWWTLLTHMFLHGSWMHLLGNMWFLWLFGNNIEDAMTRPRFLAFYLICGLAAAALQVAAAPHSAVPMVGASGAISGVMGAYLVLYPRVRVFTVIPLGFFIQTVALPAWVWKGLVDGPVAQRRRMRRISSSSLFNWRTIWALMLRSSRASSPVRRLRAPPIVKPCS